MRKVPAIAVRDGRQNVFAVARGFESDLCNSWKVFADRIGVLRVGRSNFVKVNLLIKIQISVGPLAFARKARVINARSISIPSRAPSCCGILNMRNPVREGLASRSLVKMKRPVLAAAFGKRHRDMFAIQ